MKYLFWNVHRNEKINSYIVDIIKENGCQIVGLAEYIDDIDDLLEKLSIEGINMFKVPNIACRKIQIISIFFPHNVIPCGEGEDYTIKIFPHETLGKHFIAFVHFPCKSYNKTISDYLGFISPLKASIEEVESKEGSNLSMIVGDFNMSPFEEPMVSALAFHSVISIKEAKKLTRKLRDKEYRMFYNPMWSLYGDIHETPGSYFYSTSSLVDYYWHIYDQVIIRPQIAPYFNIKELRFITKAMGADLLSNKMKRPKKEQISDHLPLFFEIH